MADNKIKITLGYKSGNDESPIDNVKYSYTLTKVSDAAIIPANINAAVARFNAHIEDDDVPLSNFFVYPYQDGIRDIIYCRGVTEVVTESSEETPISLSGGE